MQEYFDSGDISSAFTSLAKNENFINLYPSTYTSLLMGFLKNELIISNVY